MICPSCKHNNPAGQIYCDECGYKLSSTSQPLPSSPPSNTGGWPPPPSTPSSRGFPPPSTPPDMVYKQPTSTNFSNAATGQNQATGGMARVICEFCGNSTAKTGVYCGYCSKLLPMQHGDVLGGGRWTILDTVSKSKGGMGRVYVADDHKLRNVVVIKEMLDEQGRSQAERQVYLDHLKNEAAVLEMIGQVRSVPRLISGYANEQAHHYFVMEYIDGTDLDDQVKQHGALPVDTVVQYSISVCQVLEILHGRPQPIVHRDIKPENLRLRTSDGSLALLDFGVARSIREGTKITKVGTSGYVAPEQEKNQAEPRSDLYSLAATMFFLLSKKIPENDDDKQPGALRQINSSVPAWLEEIILINLSRNANERYNNANELAADLRLQRVSLNLTCPKCRMPNERRLIYCKYDATLLISQFRTCLQCNQAMPQRASYCPHCGQTALAVR